MAKRVVAADDQWRIPDGLWAVMEPLLPPGKPHPLGCHNPRVDDRRAMDAIFFVLRTGCQWNALHATDICSSSSAHRRFQEWQVSGTFERIACTLGEELLARGRLDLREAAIDGSFSSAKKGACSSGRRSAGREPRS